MDPLTHTLVGATLARTRIPRGTPFAATALIVGANLPDVDVLSHVLGDDASFAFRRGWTHGPLALVLLPLLLTMLLLAIDKKLRRRNPTRPPLSAGRLLALSYLGTWTHPALDWLNTYGIRLLMPFDGSWFYGDSVFIVDPWLWLLLGGSWFVSSKGRRKVLVWGLLAAVATALVFGARSILSPAVPWVWLGGLAIVALARQVPWIARERARVATTAAVVATIYIAGMVATSSAAEHRVRDWLVREGVQDVRDLMVGPAPANPLQWNFVVETDEHYRRGALLWWPEQRVELHGGVIERPRPSPFLDAVMAAESVRGTLNWMRFPFLEVEETAAGYTVYVIDARYAKPGDRGFGTARLYLDLQLRVIEIPLTFVE